MKAITAMVFLTLIALVACTVPETAEEPELMPVPEDNEVEQEVIDIEEELADLDDLTADLDLDELEGLEEDLDQI